MSEFISVHLGAEEGARRKAALEQIAESVGAMGQRGASVSKLCQLIADGKLEVRKMKMVIRAEQTEDGWKLVDSTGSDAQEGFEYDSKREALKAAEQLWPANSVWRGRKVRDGWQIDAQVE